MLAHALVILHPLFLLGLAALVVYLVPLLRRRLKSKLAADALSALLAVAATVVANAEQTVVANLKDPAKPGVWDDSTKLAIKASVLADARALGAGPMRDLMATGLDPERVDVLLSQMVERSVLDLHARAPQMLTNVGTISVAAPIETASAR